MDLLNPKGSKPTSPARVPSRASGAFCFKEAGSHCAARRFAFTGAAGGASNSTGAVPSSDEKTRDELTARGADGTKADALAIKVEIRTACNMIFRICFMV